MKVFCTYTVHTHTFTYKYTRTHETHNGVLVGPTQEEQRGASIYCELAKSFSLALFTIQCAQIHPLLLRTCRKLNACFAFGSFSVHDEDY